MADLDQGGTFRTKQRIWLGPSVGFIEAPSAIQRVTVAGTTLVALGNSIVTVNFNGAVTLQLPVFKGSSSFAVAVPGTFVPDMVTLIDTGGFAGAFPINILPGSGELISGLTLIQITSPFGAFVLQPDPVNGGSTVVT